MQPNPHRGEIVATINGEPRLLRLNMNALAALEAALPDGDLLSLIERFEAGRPPTADVIAVLAAGFAGAGDPQSPADVGDMTFDGGALGAARAAWTLLLAAYGGAPEATPETAS